MVYMTSNQWCMKWLVCVWHPCHLLAFQNIATPTIICLVQTTYKCIINLYGVVLTNTPFNK